MGADGNTPGDAIYGPVDKQAPQRYAPGMHSETEVAAVTDYAYDEKNPSVFWVYPPADGTSYVELSRSAVPEDITDIEDDINIGDEYEGAIIEWMLYRCFSRDSEETPNGQRALGHRSAFFQALGLKNEADAFISADVGGTQ
jgi:hypothetical protein